MPLDVTNTGTQFRQLFYTLPLLVQREACRCPEFQSNFELVGSGHPCFKDTTGKRRCKKCKKIPWTSILLLYAEECYECEVIYLVDQYPDKFKLCKECGG